MIELWKWIPEFEGLYEVSSLGRVRSHHTYRRKDPIFLKPGTTKAGYHVVSLYKNGKQHMRYIHRLVAQCFLESFDPDLEVNHKKGNGTKNSVNDIEMVTPTENIQHSFRELGRLGSATGKFGKDNPSSQWFEIIHPSGKRSKIKGLLQFCRDNNLSPQCMSLVANGKQKQHKGYRVEKLDDYQHAA